MTFTETGRVHFGVNLYAFGASPIRGVLALEFNFGLRKLHSLDTRRDWAFENLRRESLSVQRRDQILSGMPHITYLMNEST